MPKGMRKLKESELRKIGEKLARSVVVKYPGDFTKDGPGFYNQSFQFGKRQFQLSVQETFWERP